MRIFSLTVSGHAMTTVQDQTNSAKMIDKVKIERLLKLLEEATKLVGQFTGEYIHHYQTPAEFRDDLKTSIANIQQNDFTELNGLYNSFHPDSEWFDLSGDDGKRIGTEIFSIVSSLIGSFDSKDILYLINDFRQTADHAVKLFQAKYGVTNLLEGWHSRIYEQTGKLNDVGIRFYAFHGSGLAVHFRNKSIDFDFVFNPEQRHEGFDLWRLHGFVGGQPCTYNKYLDKKILEKDFNNLIEKKIIFLPKQDNSPQQYFLSDNINHEEINSIENDRPWWKIW